MSKRRILELLLEEVTVNTTGRRVKLSSGHMLATSLVWPRAGISERVAVKTIDFIDNAADMGKEKWTRKVLFKETVEPRRILKHIVGGFEVMHQEERLGLIASF